MIRRSRSPVPMTSAPEVAAIVGAMHGDPSVLQFELRVNKSKGLIRCVARGSDGRTTIRTLLGPGLQELTQYDPSEVSTFQRDQNILMLLKRGLTQTEVADTLGVSQSLVSKVYRSRRYNLC
ncbi:helix-turn-helix domain-containing protein [Pseudomonas sp. NPDC089530]|uniref:helix-turn-helix domain-containing protein n=1 Tax=Pseudomonas sp. NPDC089530 TaxID=3390651 RepID=UPI003CFFED99